MRTQILRSAALVAITIGTSACWPFGKADPGKWINREMTDSVPWAQADEWAGEIRIEFAGKIEEADVRELIRLGYQPYATLTSSPP